MYHQRRSIGKYLFFGPAVLGLTLFAPLTIQAGAISVDSTCYVGDCVSVDSLSSGQSTSGNFSLVYTFGDGDAYDIYGTYGASYSSLDGSTIDIDPIISYMGVGPSAGTDTIDFDFLQNYFDPSCCTWAGIYNESVPLNAHGTFGAGSQMSGQLFYDGVGVGPAGPFTPPGDYLVNLSNYLDFGAQDTIDTLAADYHFEFIFGQGTAPGASETGAAPEPAPLVLCGLGLLMLLFGAWRRTRSGISA